MYIHIMKKLYTLSFLPLFCCSFFLTQTTFAQKNTEKNLSELIAERKKMLTKTDKGKTIFYKCKYEFGTYTFYLNSAKNSEKRLKEEKRKANQATNTYVKNSHITRYNNGIRNYEDDVKKSKEYYSQYLKCHNKENKRYAELHTEIENLKKQLKKELVTKSNQSFLPKKSNDLRELVKKKLEQQNKKFQDRFAKPHTNSAKEYGWAMIQQLAKKGDFDAKKILASNRIQEDGFTIFSHKRQPLFISYKINIPEREDIVFRKISNDDIGLLLATQTIDYRHKTNITYFDQKFDASKTNNITTKGKTVQFPRSVSVETTIKYLDKSYNKTSRENATYYEIRDEFSKTSGRFSITQYVRIERRDMNHRLIIYRISNPENMEYDDHTYYRKNTD